MFPGAIDICRQWACNVNLGFGPAFCCLQASSCSAKAGLKDLHRSASAPGVHSLPSKYLNTAQATLNLHQPPRPRLPDFETGPHAFAVVALAHCTRAPAVPGKKVILTLLQHVTVKCSFEQRHAGLNLLEVGFSLSIQ